MASRIRSTTLSEKRRSTASPDASPEYLEWNRQLYYGTPRMLIVAGDHVAKYETEHAHLERLNLLTPNE